MNRRKEEEDACHNRDDAGITLLPNDRNDSAAQTGQRGGPQELSYNNSVAAGGTLGKKWSNSQRMITPATSHGVKAAARDV